MSATQVETQFQKQCDHIGAYKRAIVVAISGRGHLWNMVDDTQTGSTPDAVAQAYEDRIKGSLLTAVDVILDAAKLANNINDWLSIVTGKQIGRAHV